MNTPPTDDPRLKSSRESAERFITMVTEGYPDLTERLEMLGDYHDYQISRVRYHDELIEKYKHDSFLIYGHVREREEHQAKIEVVEKEIAKLKEGA